METVTSTSLIIAAAVVFTIVIQKLQQHHQVSQFSKTNRCQTIPQETDLWYDYLGIFKLVELASSFRERKSLVYTNALFDKYGDTYESNIIGQKLIFTYNTHNIRHILTTGFSDYDSSQLRAHLFRPITPQGVFTADGAEWRRIRNLLRSQFSNNRLICDLDIFEKHVQIFIQSVPPKGEAFDLQTRFADLCLDITTSFTLGEHVDALSPTRTHEKKQFMQDLLCIKETIHRDGVLGPLRHLFRQNQYSDACARARNFVMFYAYRAVESRNEESHGGQEGERTAQGYAFIRGLTEHTKDVSELTDQSLSLLLAAVDSVTTLLSATFFLLAQNERVVRKLRASILDSIGNECPTYEQLKTLGYMRCVFNEGQIFPG